MSSITIQDIKVKFAIFLLCSHVELQHFLILENKICQTPKVITRPVLSIDTEDTEEKTII